MKPPGELSPLELAGGLALGTEPTSPSVPRTSDVTPRHAFEKSFVPSLERQPCCVSFSGGRDSSAVLATAVHVARREGLPDPIPVTLRYPGFAEADENEWQEMVIAHLGVTEWERVDIHEELDVLSDIAKDLLLRHGVMWPANVQTLVPIARVARGGSVLTGLDGDGLLGGWRCWELGDVLARRKPPAPRDAARLAFAFGPRVIRRARMSRQRSQSLPWLTAQAERAFNRQLIRADAEEPGWWGARIRWWARRRYVELTRRSMSKVGSDHDVLFGYPLLDRRFLAALAQASPVAGLGNRTRMMALLFGDLLPLAVIERDTKATFNEPFWQEATREFTSRWDGEAVDPAIVDVDGLRRTWREGLPQVRTALLAQSIWLATSRDRA